MDMYDPSIMQLDEEFRTGLQNIREYLMHLTSPHAARCCGEWLQKLRESSDERELRNVLLKRLTCQVQTRSLQYPFDRLPPDKPLYKIYEDADISSWYTDYESNSTKDQLTPSVECQDADDTRNNEDGIWYEMQACGTRHGGRGDDVPQKRGCSLPITYSPRISKNNRADNEMITREVNNWKEEAGDHVRTNNKKNDSNNEKPTARQAEELTSYLEDYKTLLTDYKRVVNQNITDLSERLETAIENNQVQKSDLRELQTSLQENWTAKLESLENELVSEVSKLEYQLQSDRSKYEVKIEQLKKIIQEKDEKINSLDSKIRHQADSLKEKMEKVENEINMAAKENDLQYKKKYSYMKKQLLDLENINKELSKEYHRNISQTVKDYENKMNSVKLMAASESMIEMEDKVKQLEQAYQKIFSDYKRKMEHVKSKETKKLHSDEINTENKNK